jgi:translation initiation factor IF-2
MAETKTPGDKTLSVSSKTLSLKPRSETGVVRQSFSHGRTKSVVVEKKPKRRMPGEGGAPVVEAKPAPAPTPAARPTPPAAQAAPARPATATTPRGAGVLLRTLTEEERSARASALADSRVREVEERRIAEEEAARRVARESVERTEREAAEAR